MSENMKKFLELVSKDETLKQKMQAFSDMEPKDAISASIALAKELGIELSEADFAKEELGSELIDDELDAVVGGSSSSWSLMRGLLEAMEKLHGDILKEIDRNGNL